MRKVFIIKRWKEGDCGFPKENRARLRAPEKESHHMVGDGCKGWVECE